MAAEFTPRSLRFEGNTYEDKVNNYQQDALKFQKEAEAFVRGDAPSVPGEIADSPTSGNNATSTNPSQPATGNASNPSLLQSFINRFSKAMQSDPSLKVPTNSTPSTADNATNNQQPAKDPQDINGDGQVNEADHQLAVKADSQPAGQNNTPQPDASANPPPPPPDDPLKGDAARQAVGYGNDRGKQTSYASSFDEGYTLDGLKNWQNPSEKDKQFADALQANDGALFKAIGGNDATSITWKQINDYGKTNFGW